MVDGLKQRSKELLWIQRCTDEPIISQAGGCSDVVSDPREGALRVKKLEEAGSERKGSSRKRRMRGDGKVEK